MQMQMEKRYTAQKDAIEVSQHQLWSKVELAEYLGISVEEVQKLGPVYAVHNVTTSELPYIKIGNKFYYSKLAIDLWL